MFATGMMDPDWWKYSALDHRWFRDDDTYADYSKDGSMICGLAVPYIGVHFDGAEGYNAVLFPKTSGAASFTPSDAPFELQISSAMELKCPDGTVKYRVNKIVCEDKTLTFTMTKLSSNEEITVTMGIAPDSFTTNLFKDFSIQPNKTESAEATARPSSEWICPCGAVNIGNFCSQCGHPRG